MYLESLRDQKVRFLNCTLIVSLFEAPSAVLPSSAYSFPGFNENPATDCSKDIGFRGGCEKIHGPHCSDDASLLLLSTL